MSFITSIGTANPSHRHSQQVIGNFMAKAMGLSVDEARKLQALFRATGIETRYSVLGDYGRDHSYDFYPDNETLSPFPSTKQRLALFRRHALALSLSSSQHCLEKITALKKNEITHLIVASCTGMYAPG